MNHPQDDNIPTLTDIIQIGDESMKNHFDARYFDDENGIDEQSVTHLPPADHEALRETVESLIQEALDETLPVIENQLRDQLIQKVLTKLQHTDSTVDNDPV